MSKRDNKQSRDLTTATTYPTSKRYHVCRAPIAETGEPRALAKDYASKRCAIEFARSLAADWPELEWYVLDTKTGNCYPAQGFGGPATHVFSF